MSFFWFLINPIVGFLRAMKNLRGIDALIVFVLFYGIYGYATSFELTSADSYRIGARFCQTEYSLRLVWQMYINGTIPDVYLVLVFSILKPFTNNPKVLMGVFGLVMGVFASLSIRQLYNVWQSKRTTYFYLIVFFYFLIISFFNIQTVRFNTASSVFSYFVIQYLYFGKKDAFWGIAVTPLIHFGYWVAIIAFAAYILIVKLFNSTRLCYWIMALSFVAYLSLPQSAIDDMMSVDEDTEVFVNNSAINRKITSYSKATEKTPDKTYYKEESRYRQANSVFTRTFDYINKIGMFLFLSFFYTKRKSIVQAKDSKNFFNYVLFSFAVGYIASLFMNCGGRFVALANMLFLFWFLSVFQHNYSIRWKKYAMLFILVYFYNIAFFFFNVARVVTPMFWGVPPIITFLDGLGFGPIDYVFK